MTKYEVEYTNVFKRNLKKCQKQGKNIDKLMQVIELLANKKHLPQKYKNHILKNDKYYENCGECHIEPDWLLVYKYIEKELILLLVSTGSHSELFKK